MIKKIFKRIWSHIWGNIFAEDAGVMCCFCNEGIMCIDPDPADIVIIANIDKPKEEQAEQIFYCHVACLKSKIHKDIEPLFVLDDVTKQNR